MWSPTFGECRTFVRRSGGRFVHHSGQKVVKKRHFLYLGAYIFLYLGAYIFVRQDGGLFVRRSGGFLGQKKVLKTQKKKLYASPVHILGIWAQESYVRA